jgi:hypothetical protein
VPERMRAGVSSMHLPLKNVALCLDCDVCFELGQPCPACGSESWAPVARFLERMGSDALARLMTRAHGPAGPARPRAADGIQHLVIVSRDQPALYRHLGRALMGNRTIRVVLDRRDTVRAAAHAAAFSERRWRTIDDQLRTLGWAIVPAGWSMRAVK